MLALTVSHIASIVQIGFIIGVGLLLDTFLVRTITVPAAAVLIGKFNWWPSKGRHGHGRAEAPDDEDSDSESVDTAADDDLELADAAGGR
jgi:RND superfamily putative drug exporter